MQIAASRTYQLMKVYGALFAVIAVAGISAVYFPTATMGISLIVTGAIAALGLVKKTNVLVSALTCYGVLIAFPAFLPRPEADREGPAYGGSLDTRALAQLAIFAMVLAIGCWLWLLSDMGLSDLLRSPVNLLVMYATLILISLAYTPKLAWPAYGLFKLTVLIAVITVLSSTIKTAAQLKRTIDFLLASITMVLGVYWFDVLRGAARKSSGRYETVWLHPNHATLLAVTLMLVLTVRFLVSPNPSHQTRIVAFAGFGAISALIAASKSSLGAAAIAIVLVTLVVMVKKPTGSMLVRITVFLIGVFGVLNYFIAHNLGIVAHLSSYEKTDPTSLTGRVPVWNTAIDATLSNNFATLFGHGYLSTFSIGLQGEYWVARQAHNSFIQTFFDLGLVGVALVLILYLSSWSRVWRAIHRYSIYDPRWTRALELLAVLTALTVVSFTEDIMGGTVENHTMIFFLTVFCIYKNLTVSLGVNEAPEPNVALRTLVPKHRGRGGRAGDVRRIRPTYRRGVQHASPSRS